MQTVRQIPMEITHPTDRQALDELMRVFGSAKRYAFNRLLEGMNPKDLIKHLQHQFPLNKRYSEDSVLLAQSLIASQKELLPMRWEDAEAKVAKTTKKIEDYQTGRKKPKKVDLDTCLKGLQARLEKWQTKAYELRTHLDYGTIPTVIFGGKKNFYERIKGNLSHDEWKDLRTNQLYARGDKSKKGNLNIRLTYNENEERFYAEIANPLLQEGAKRIPRICVPVRIPPKYEKEMIHVVMGNQTGINPKGNPVIEYIPYTVDIQRKKGRYTLYVSFEETVYGQETTSSQPFMGDRIAGIDINIDRIAVSILSKQGNFLKSQVFYCHELEYVKSHKRDNLIGETVKRLFDWLLDKNIGCVVIENIKLRQQHDTNRRFNRLTHSFAKKKLLQTIVRRGLRYGFQIKKVNPAYTSVIGRFKYMQTYGISIHESASLVIGRRGLGYDERLSKENIVTLQTLVKPHLIGLLGSMEESYKQSPSGKKQRQYLGMMVKKINTWKTQHRWSLWNVFHKFCWMKQGQILLKEG